MVRSHHMKKAIRSPAGGFSQMRIHRRGNACRKRACTFLPWGNHGLSRCFPAPAFPPYGVICTPVCGMGTQHHPRRAALFIKPLPAFPSACCLCTSSKRGVRRYCLLFLRIFEIISNSKARLPACSSLPPRASPPLVCGQDFFEGGVQSEGSAEKGILRAVLALLLPTP